MPAGDTCNFDDADFLGRLRAGDAAAFETMVRATTARLLATARRFLRDDGAARDAVQESFLQAFRALPGFEGSAALGTWLHSILVRNCLMKLRRDRAHPTEQILDGMLPSFARDGHRRNVGPAWRSAPEAAITDEERQLVHERIGRLPEDFRNVILLRDIEELDTRQVAALLEVSESVVKTRLHRAHQALRELLDPSLRKGSL